MINIVWLAIGLGLAALAATAPLRYAAAIVVVCLPLSGTAVWMLGEDPILLPLTVCLGFLARHAFSLLIPAQRAQFIELARQDAPMLAFIAYCVISGLFFPRLFENGAYITPQGGGPAVSLGPWLISMPQMAYLAFGAWTYLALRHAMLRVGLAPMLYGVLAQILLIGGFGLIQAVLGLAGINVPTNWIVNNEAYRLLLNIIEGGFVRVTSVFVEASVFGQWGAGALAFCYALYVNRIHPTVSLILMGGVGAALLLSTSSTSYFGLLAVAGFAIVHAMLDPDRRRRDRGLLILLAGALVAAFAAIVVFSSNSGFLGELRQMILTMTIEKSASSSAIERGQWAARSIANAFDTALLGVGYGAARSSGLFVSLFGMVGLPGLVLMAFAFGPILLRAFRRLRTGEDAVAAAAAFGLFGSFAAMGLSAPDLALPNMFWAYAAIAAAPLAQRAAQRARSEALAAAETPA